MPGEKKGTRGRERAEFHVPARLRSYRRRVAIYGRRTGAHLLSIGVRGSILFTPSLETP